MYVYKIKYASYLESLQPDQREAELVRTNAKSAKRGNNRPKQNDQVINYLEDYESINELEYLFISSVWPYSIYNLHIFA